MFWLFVWVRGDFANMAGHGSRSGRGNDDDNDDDDDDSEDDEHDGWMDGNDELRPAADNDDRR